MDGNEIIGMTRILFVCHGNICRSPMAESVFAAKVRERRLEWAYTADSAAVSAEEIGNPVHPGTQRVLAAHGIPCLPHRARQITADDYRRFDLLIGMDASNLRRMRALCGGDPQQKCRLLLDFTAAPRDVADPWYTGDFEAAYRDILCGCEGILASCAHR